MKFIQAKHYHPGRYAAIGVIVIHDMEMKETGTTAESCAKMFATTTRKASVHYMVDNDSMVQGVHDHDTAWGAKGGNSRAIHVEHAGYVTQRFPQWTDAYSRAMLALSAGLTARLCAKYKIPIKHLTPAELARGDKGIVGHDTVTAAFHISGGHTDPGAYFPWKLYIGMVEIEAAALAKKPVTVSKAKAILGAGGAGAALIAALLLLLPTAPAPKPTPRPVPSASSTGAPVGSPTTKPSPKPTPKPSVKPSPKPVVKCSISGVVRKPQHNAQVKVVQKIVNVYADGWFGQRTKSKVQVWQRAKHLSADGAFGKNSARAAGCSWKP